MRSKYNIDLTRWGKSGKEARTIDGVTFDSLAEAKRWCDLRTLEKNNLVHRLERQVRYDFIINGVNCGFYKADFRYVNDKGETVVEDVKGMRLSNFAIKAKLMRALYGIVVQEIGGSKRR